MGTKRWAIAAMPKVFRALSCMWDYRTISEMDLFVRFAGDAAFFGIVRRYESVLDFAFLFGFCHICLCISGAAILSTARSSSSKHTSRQEQDYIVFHGNYLGYRVGFGYGVMRNTYIIMPDIAAYSIRNGYSPYKAK